jgi:hypothetical protein
VQVLENCNYAVELGKKLNFVLVGIGGELFRSLTPAPPILMVVVLETVIQQISGKKIYSTCNSKFRIITSRRVLVPHIIFPTKSFRKRTVSQDNFFPEYRIFVFSNFMENMWR